jgi:choline kinase
VDREAWQMEYEDALVGFFRDVKVGHEKIGGLPWTEIDFMEDVTKAERDVLPKL